MTVDEVLHELEALGSDAVRSLAVRAGSPAQFGVLLGRIRAVAKRVKRDDDLALALWATGNTDARLVAILVTRPSALEAEQLEEWVASASCQQEADWVNAYLVRKHRDREELRQRWLESDDPMLARSAWDLTAVRAEKDPDGLDLGAVLDRIDRELPQAAPLPQWTMNNALAAIGIAHESLRARSIAIGEQHGVYRDYPTPKNCTSPFAPEWIAAMTV